MKYNKYAFYIFVLCIFYSCKKADKSTITEKVVSAEITVSIDSVTDLKQEVLKSIAIKKDSVISQKDSVVGQEVKKEESFITRSLLDNKLSISMPNNFTVMDENIVKLKYPRLTKNSVVYSNKKSTVSIAIGLTEHQSTEKALPEIKKTLDAQYSKSSAKLISNNIRKINGKDFILMEFTSPAVDGTIYNLMFITSIENRLLMGTFNCTEPLRKEWEPKVKSMVNTIKAI